MKRPQSQKRPRSVGNAGEKACQPALGGKGAVAAPQKRRIKATFYRADLGLEGDGA